jgi:DNA-binding MarR family transcriptional regulator
MPLRLVPPIHRATHRIGLYLAGLREGGLSQGEAHVLAQLAAASPATIAALHRGLAHKRSTLTSIIDRLVDRGLVTRDVGVADRRTFVIALTSRGRAVARRVRAHLAALERAVGRRVTRRELTVFLKVTAAVEDEAHRATRAAPSRQTPGRARG